MKLVTWNVNSLKVRMPRVLELLGALAPDVVLMQETKTEAAAFPADELAAAGYDAVHHSAGRWAGVAILARTELGGIGAPHAGLPGESREDEARWIEATVAGLRVASVYVPNGREVGSPTYDEKLAFLDAMARRAGQLRDAGPLFVGGDFNVAPADIDVYDPVAFAGSTHVQPEERSRIEAIIASGNLVDAYRHLHPDDVQHTWWDYRQGHFHRGLGLRIDLALVSAARAETLVSCGIARDFRKGTKPSDHAPLVTEMTS
jgi:exodeoxyribonuclease-3